MTNPNQVPESNQEELTDQERWEEDARQNNLCSICTNERTICGGEEVHG